MKSKCQNIKSVSSEIVRELSHCAYHLDLLKITLTKSYLGVLTPLKEERILGILKIKWKQWTGKSIIKLY